MNRKFAVVAAIFAVGLLMTCVPLFAHHGNAAYDSAHPITITGTITEFVWSNPHCQFYLDVKDDKGNVVNWAVESMSPGILVRDGWHKSTLKPGDQVSITLVPAKNGAPVGFSGNAYHECKVVRVGPGDPIPTFTDKTATN
jgi:hypothetical protein